MTAALFLFADEPIVIRPRGGHALVRLNGILKAIGTPPAGRLELSLDGPRADTQRITLDSPPRSGTSYWARTVALVDLGEYRAEWSFGDARSNPVELRVTDAPEPLQGPALTVEAIPSLGIRGEPDLLVRLANLTDAVLDRSLAFLGCAAIVDGQRAAMPRPTWDGAYELPPHERTWFLLALDDFDPRPGPGPHEVQIEMAGHTSSAVRITIPPR